MILYRRKLNLIVYCLMTLEDENLSRLTARKVKAIFTNIIAKNHRLKVTRHISEVALWLKNARYYESLSLSRMNEDFTRVGEYSLNLTQCNDIIRP